MDVNRPDSVGELTDHSVQIIKQSDSGAILLINVDKLPNLKGKFMVTGLPTNDSFARFVYYNTSDMTGDLTVFNLHNGENDVDISPTETQNRFYVYIPVQPNIESGAEINVLIESIPEYPGALIYDGVDDYSELSFGYVENYPEIGGMFILVKILSEDTSTNRFILNQGSGSETGRLLCYIDTQGRVVAGSPGKVNVIDENGIISYTRDPSKVESAGAVMTLGGLSGNYYSNIALYELRLTRNKPTDQQVELIKADMLRKYNEEISNS